MAQTQLMQHNRIITLVAGTGVAGYSGLNGLATEAPLNESYGVAVDAQGNLYIADTQNHRILMVDVQKNITLIAGTGMPGNLGINGPAIDAQLYYPAGVAVDVQGNLYIADTQNHRFLMVDVQKNITLVAGSWSLNGPATEAQLSESYGVAVDAQGNLYIADTQNHRILMVDVQKNITLVAGTGVAGNLGINGPATEAQLSHPFGVAVDAQGNLYIADLQNHRILMVDVQKNITLVAGTGVPGNLGINRPATEAQLSHPFGVAVDAQGNLYIADLQNHRILMVDVQKNITLVAGTGVPGNLGINGPATEAQLYYPAGIAVDRQGNLYIADQGNHRILFIR